tara:strand:- start:277 stop:549 length:273 start_codon:yes stop_codon:yes gene_type:complete
LSHYGENLYVYNSPVIEQLSVWVKSLCRKYIERGRVSLVPASMAYKASTHDAALINGLHCEERGGPGTGKMVASGALIGKDDLTHLRSAI